VIEHHERRAEHVEHPARVALAEAVEQAIGGLGVRGLAALVQLALAPRDGRIKEGFHAAFLPPSAGRARARFSGV
jgi:formaldehyde-activating enzyme involved in methanogenesis